ARPGAAGGGGAGAVAVPPLSARGAPAATHRAARPAPPRARPPRARVRVRALSWAAGDA
ncbi:unnamed protein product, partial [Coccothraustes coccothraustes]